MPSSDLLFDIGFINASRIFAYEGFTKFKYNPKVIKRLIETNIIQGDIAIAKKFIKMLKESFIYREWAEEYEKYIKNSSSIQSNNLLRSKQNYAIKDDFFIDNISPKKDMINLLKANKNNKLALDYLFASFLLEGSLTNLFNNLSLFKEAGISKLPLHVQEAILIHGMIRKMDIRVLVKTYSIDLKVVKKFVEFTTIIKQNRSNIKLAQQIAYQNFRTTFWYYIRFLHPSITGLQMKSQAQDVNKYKF